MIRRDLELPPDDVYPPDPWRLIETRFFPERLAQFETLFALSNGYVGVRGAHDEGAPAYQRGTIINGFHETWPITYAEPAFGFARVGQTIVSATDAFVIRLLVDDEPLYLPTAYLPEYARVLDMRAGLLERDLLWQTPAGKRVRVRSTRLVSFEHRHLSAIEYDVVIENADGWIDLISEIGIPAATAKAEDSDNDDPRLHSGFTGRVLFPQKAYAHDRRIALSHKTGRSGMTLACAADHVLRTDNKWSERIAHDEDHGRCCVSIEAKQGVAIRLVKFVTHHTSRRSPAEDLCDRAERTLDRARDIGFDALRAAQKDRMDAFWDRADVEITGSKQTVIDAGRIQQIVRLNLLHIYQACARAEGAGVPAKGLTGRGYEGHYFWDTEIYVLPFLIYTEPRLARNLLRFRLSLLDAARARAQQVNQRGALFPWRTINGEEASAYYAAGTAQYHINADIVYAIRQYTEATGDDSLLKGRGIEALIETARLWRDLGFFSEQHDNGFCIAGVTGPDEYNTVVNNNVYTNLMARENLRWAAACVQQLRKSDPGRYAALERRLKIEPEEIEEWQRAAEAMRLPYDDSRGIHLQDDEFLDKKPWDFANTPPDHYPLLLRYHPLVIYRSMLIKQADVILAMFLLGEQFSPEQKRRDFEFYDPLTTGDSSLSACIQAIIAAEIGDIETAREYTRYSALMDFADVGRNVKDGCHIASMGGTWMTLVHGFGGFRDHRGRFSFDPRIVNHLERLRFRLTLAGSRLEVDLTPARAKYRLLDGDAITFRHESEDVTLSPDAPEAERTIKPAPSVK